MNIAKLHLFVGRGSRTVMVVIINAAYCLGVGTIGNGVSIVLSSKGYSGRCGSGGCGSRS